MLQSILIYCLHFYASVSRPEAGKLRRNTEKLKETFAKTGSVSVNMSVDCIDSTPIKTHSSSGALPVWVHRLKAGCEPPHVPRLPNSILPTQAFQIYLESRYFSTVSVLWKKRDLEDGVNTDTVKRIWQPCYCLGLIKLLTLMLALHKGTEMVRCILKQKQCQSFF